MPSRDNAELSPSAPPAARWVELSVWLPPGDAELVSEVLGQIAPGGALVEPAIDLSNERDFSYELLDTPGEVRAYLTAPHSEAARRALRRRLSTLPLSAPLPRLRYREVEEFDWASEWRRFYHVQRLGRRIVIRPSWEAYEPQPGEVVIALDPGAAFGTGQHESTRLSAAALERGVRPGADVLDVGTGSGILAIVAARLGAGSVRALDVDADVIAVARENAIRAGVAGQLVVAQGSVGSAWPWPHPQARSADVTVANISAATLIDLMPALAETLRPGGLLMLSGFLDEAAATVAAAVQAAGLHPLRSDGEGEWRCLTVIRRAAG